MNYLVKEVVEHAARKYNMKRAGNKWVGKTCPKCGTSRSGNDKFHFWDDGGWKCWSCESSGDIIDWLRGKCDEGLSMNCAEAHEYVNVDCLSSTCPYVTKCRITRGGRRPPKKNNYFDNDYQKRNGINIIESVFYPHDKWVERMTALVEKAVAKIGHEQAVLDWLAKRGVNKGIVQSNKFGWLPHDERIPIEELGMVYDPDGSAKVTAGTITYDKKKLWVPGGIVMPLYSDGRLFAVDIRRTKEAQEKFAHNIKYMFVKGGGVAYRSLWNGAPGIKPKAVVLIESRLDASMVSYYCPEVAIIVGKDKPLTRIYAEYFKKVDLILICTDNDQPNKSGLRAGEEKAKKWEAEFQNAHFWPVPKGKDPGEFFEQGGDIKKWIYSGIEKFSGNVFQPSPRPVDDFGDVESMVAHGYTIYIVDSEERLQKIASKDKIVFERQDITALKDSIDGGKEVLERLIYWQRVGIKQTYGF